MEWKDVPTPEEIINVGKKKFSDFSKYFILAGVALFVLIGLNGLIYSIGPDEVGVIQRFGKYIRLSPPGLHAKIPLGIEKVTRIKVEKIFKEEFGTGKEDSFSSVTLAGNKDVSLMLTGDLNILDVRWIVQYKIKDPIKFLFVVRNPRNIIRDVSEVIMRRLVGDYTVDEVLTIKREEIDHLAQVETQKILDE